MKALLLIIIITPSKNRHNHFALPSLGLGRSAPSQAYAPWVSALRLYLAQGHKHAGRSLAQTHIDGIVIMSPALFR